MTEEQVQAAAEAIGRMIKEMLDADHASSLTRIDTATARAMLEAAQDQPKSEN